MNVSTLTVVRFLLVLFFHHIDDVDRALVINSLLVGKFFEQVKLAILSFAVLRGLTGGLHSLLLAFVDTVVRVGLRW